MIQEQRVILKSIGYGEEGSYNDIVAKDHSQGTARWPISVQRNPRKRTVANPTAPQEKSLKSPSTSSTLKAASKLKKKSRVETLCEKKASQRKL